MPRCRCHSRREARRCCGPLHAGKPAPTPLALMRSRYAAYARGLVDYILDTTDPEGPQWRADRGAWADEVRAFCANTRFAGLHIDEAPPPSDTEGFVTFTATLVRGEQDLSFTERSRFVRGPDGWRYHGPEASDGGVRPET